MKKIIALILVVLLMVACTYSLNLNSRPDLKTVQIKNFSNKSDKFLLEEELLSSLTQQFNADGRLKITDSEPSCLLEGEILDYSDKPDKYDTSENIIERKVRVMLNIKFTDLTKDEVMWEARATVIDKNYAVSGDNVAQLPTTEPDARNLVWNELFEMLMRNSLEAW